MHLISHARRRAKERYNLFLSEEDIEKMNERIRGGDAKHLMTESLTRAHFLVDDFLIAVYNSKLKSIATFLPPQCIFQYLPMRESD